MAYMWDLGELQGIPDILLSHDLMSCLSVCYYLSVAEELRWNKQDLCSKPSTFWKLYVGEGLGLSRVLLVAVFYINHLFQLITDVKLPHIVDGRDEFPYSKISGK